MVLALTYPQQECSDVLSPFLLSYCQVCSAGSKLLVQETIHDKFIGKLKQRLTHFRVGSSLDKAMDMGAIVDESQLATVAEYVDSARNEGAEVSAVQIFVNQKSVVGLSFRGKVFAGVKFRHFCTHRN